MVTDTQHDIAYECDLLKHFLIEKNKAYGDSALNPCRIFSKADTVEQLKVRIDDKINRMMQGNEYEGDDTEKDLAGYLILLSIAKRRASGYDKRQEG